jgi:RNA polymerase sigma-70 factor, ECF subfamily
VDRDLVEQARRGDREAFAVLVHQVSDSLYAVAQRILRDSALAEDALQNALVLAWRRIPHLREPDRFEAWIHRILVHACYDESQRARQWTANVRVLPVDGPTIPDGSAVIADRDELERAFRRLPISTSGRSSCCTTTSGCPWWRSPRCWRSPPGRPDRACTTPPAHSATL